MIIPSNQGVDEWVEFVGDAVVATALLDRLLQCALVIPMEGNA